MATARMALAMSTTTQFPLLLTLPHFNFIRNGAVLRAAAAAPIAHSFPTISSCSCPFSFSRATPRVTNLAILARGTEVGSENAATEAKSGDSAIESKSEDLPTEVESTEAKSEDIAIESKTEDLPTEAESTEAKSEDIATESKTEDLPTEAEAQDDAIEVKSGDIGTESKTEDLATEAESEVPPENQGLKLYVGNLPWSCDSTQLAEICQDFGVVDTVEVVFEQETGRSRGFAFVAMASNEDARAVIKALDGSDLGGRPLKVDFPRPSKNNPRIVNYTRGRSGNINKVFVGNLPWACDDEALALLFSGYGKIVEAKVVYDKESGRSRGFGFVTMGSAGEVNTVIENLNGADYEGRELKVTLVDDKKPRSPSQ